MADQSPAVTVSHPPEGLLRAVNPTLRFLLRTPLAGPASRQLMVLSFRGRKTGNRYSTPVSAHLIDNQLYALAGAPWTRNFRGAAAAEVVHDGKTTTMNGVLIEDPAAVADLSHRLAEFLRRQESTTHDGAGVSRSADPHRRGVQGGGATRAHRRRATDPAGCWSLESRLVVFDCGRTLFAWPHAPADPAAVRDLLGVVSKLNRFVVNGDPRPAPRPNTISVRSDS